MNKISYKNNRDNPNDQLCRSYNHFRPTKNINKYGFIIIYGTKILQKEIAEDPANEMLNIKRLIPGIELDLNYATADGFMHEKLYPSSKTAYL